MHSHARAGQLVHAPGLASLLAPALLSSHLLRMDRARRQERQSHKPCTAYSRKSRQGACLPHDPAATTVHGSPGLTEALCLQSGTVTRHCSSANAAPCQCEACRGDPCLARPGCTLWASCWSQALTQQDGPAAGAQVVVLQISQVRVALRVLRPFGAPLHPHLLTNCTSVYSHSDMATGGRSKQPRDWGLPATAWRRPAEGRCSGAAPRCSPGP